MKQQEDQELQRKLLFHFNDPQIKERTLDAFETLEKRKQQF